ncbi:MAG: SMC-Scp complex subunit ScpB [Candidatus Omnitrophota bacterium]
MEQENLIGAVEALIFVSGDPVPLKRLAELLEKEETEIKGAVDALSERYAENASALQIMEVAGGFQLRTRPVYSVHINRFLERKRKTTLSGPALETLAIIAYKQPITRAEIEAIRGVGIDGVLKSLLDKRLVKVKGVKEVPGRPNLYGTTKYFLEYFGISSLKDLPPIEDISETFSSVSALDNEIEEITGDDSGAPEENLHESANVESDAEESQEENFNSPQDNEE